MVSARAAGNGARAHRYFTQGNLANDRGRALSEPSFGVRMRTRRKGSVTMSRKLVLFCAVWLTLPCVCWGQGYGSISGTVSDPSGAVVPNAIVIAIEVGTEAATTGETNAEGHYNVLQLRPGLYFISAEATTQETLAAERQGGRCRTHHTRSTPGSGDQLGDRGCHGGSAQLRTEALRKPVRSSIQR